MNKFVKDKPVDNVLVGIIGIQEYIPATGLNDDETKLTCVDGDVQNCIELFNETMGYRTMVLSGDNKNNKRGDKYIYETDVSDFLAKVHRSFVSYKDEDETIRKYDALIMVISGHGYNESLVTSEGGLVSFRYIQHLGGNTLDADLRADTIRLFIFDVCRGGEIMCVKKIKRKTKGPDGDERVWKPKFANAEMNICALYSVPNGYAAPNEGTFIETIKDTMEDIMDEKEQKDTCTLDEICMKISRDIGGRTDEYYCPQYVTHNKFKIILKKRDADKKKKVKYYEIEDRDQPTHHGKFKKTSTNALEIISDDKKANGRCEDCCCAVFVKKLFKRQ